MTLETARIYHAGKSLVFLCPVEVDDILLKVVSYGLFKEIGTIVDFNDSLEPIAAVRGRLRRWSQLIEDWRRLQFP